jgi:hypothetical protein
LKYGFATLRNRPNDRPFSFDFIGEGSCDAGGPSRDVMTNMCDELMTPEIHPLFVPTANNIASVEPQIDCLRLDPYITDPIVLLKVKFFGYFLGCAIK